MTIRQQGGVFGRNPKFNDVEASSVTISSENNPVLLAERTANTADIDLVDPQSTARIRNVAGRVQFYADANNERADSGFRFYVDNLRKVDIDTNGNIVFANSGSGIDFSATSGTGSSELFDDYEEGTFTATLTGTTTNPTTPVTATDARYTKVGRTVYVTMNFANFSNVGASGGIQVTGLPFTSANTARHIGSALLYSIGTFTGSIVTHLGANSTVVSVFESISNSAYNHVQHNAGTGRYMWLSFMYDV